MIKCPKCGYIEPTRSRNQNDTYWGFCVEPLALFLSDRGYDKDDVHELLKMECNYKIMISPDKDGLMVEKRIPQSTTGLTKKQFNEYFDRILRYAASLGCYLTMPDDPKED